MNRLPLSTLVAAIGLLSTASHAVPFELQGTVRSLTPLANGHAALVCGSVTTIVTPTTVINSPSRRLSLAQLLDATPFPAAGFSAQTGQPRAGFVGGTCVAIGDDALVPGQLTVTDLGVEVEENSLIGATASAPAAGGVGFNILGTPAVALTDARMSAVRLAAGFYNADGSHPGSSLTAAAGLADASLETARQQYGFGVDLATVPSGDLSAADGYHGSDGIFYFHTLETTLGTLLRKEPRPSIQRASCQNTNRRDSILARGGCVGPVGATSVTVTLQGQLSNGTYQTYGTATCLIDTAAAPANSGYTVGRYDFRNDGLTLAGNACPSAIRASTTIGGVTRHDFLRPDLR